MPDGLSPDGQSWFNRYAAYAAQTEADCHESQRKLDRNPSGHTKLRCDNHPSPPLFAKAEQYRARDAGIAPLVTLPLHDGLTLAQFFIDHASTSDLYGDDLRAMGQFVATGGTSTTAPPAPLTPKQELRRRQDADSAAEIARINATEANKYSNPFFWIYYGLIALFWAGVSVLLLVMFGPRLARHLRDARLSAAGYRPPINWTEASPILGLLAGDGGDNAPRRSLVTSRLIKERSSLPPFVLWFAQGGQDGGKWPGEWRWLSAVDGNSNLVAAGAPMQNYLQIMWKGDSELSLYAISLETARDLRVGPYGLKDIPVADLDGRPLTISIHTGTKGASIPRPQAPPSGNQGTGREGKGSKTSEAL